MKQTQESLSPLPPLTSPPPAASGFATAAAAGLLGLIPLFLALGLVSLCFVLAYATFLQQPLKIDQGWVNGLGHWSGRRALVLWTWNTAFIGLTALFAAYCAGLNQGLSAGRALLTPAAIAVLFLTLPLSLGLSFLASWALLGLFLCALLTLLLILSLGASAGLPLRLRLSQAVWVRSFSFLFGFFFLSGGAVLLAPPLGIASTARTLSPVTPVMFILLVPVALVLGRYARDVVPVRLSRWGLSVYWGLALALFLPLLSAGAMSQFMQSQRVRQANLSERVNSLYSSLKLEAQQRWPRPQTIMGSAQERYGKLLANSQPMRLSPLEVKGQMRRGVVLPTALAYQKHLSEMQVLQLAIHSSDFEVQIRNAQWDYARAIEYARIWVAAAQFECLQQRQRAGISAMVQTMQMGEDLILNEFSLAGATAGQAVYALPLRYLDRCLQKAPKIQQQRFVMEQSRLAYEHHPFKRMRAVLNANRLASLKGLTTASKQHLEKQTQSFKALFEVPLMQDALQRYLNSEMPQKPREIQAWLAQFDSAHNPYLTALGQDMGDLIQEMQFTATLAGARYIQAGLERYRWLYKRYPDSLHGVLAFLSEEPRDLRTGERFVYTYMGPNRYRLETVGTGLLQAPEMAKASDRLLFLPSGQ